MRRNDREMGFHAIKPEIIERNLNLCFVNGAHVLGGEEWLILGYNVSKYINLIIKISHNWLYVFLVGYFWNKKRKPSK